MTLHTRLGLGRHCFLLGLGLNSDANLLGSKRKLKLKLRYFLLALRLQLEVFVFQSIS